MMREINELWKFEICTHYLLNKGRFASLQIATVLEFDNIPSVSYIRQP